MRRRDGFTIIEVSLVLAIGGLILMMVFIALPALQRNQRDAQRREDVLLLLEKVKDYQQSNRGALPDFPAGGSGTTISWDDSADSSWKEFYRKYLGDKFMDPNGEHYALELITCSGPLNSACPGGEEATDTWSFSDRSYRIRVARNASCDNQQIITSSNPRKVAAAYKLEGGGVFCASI